MSLPETRFSYCLEIGGREFNVHTDSNNWIHFEDYQYAREVRAPELGNLELKAFCGSGSARRLLAEETATYTVSRPIPDDLSSFLDVALEMFESDNWLVEHEERLDELLIPFFWVDVNPRLRSPLKSPETNG